MRTATGALLVLTCLVVLTGCPINPIPTPPEAVLKGTWELRGDLVADEVSDFLITFNSQGEITRLSYRFGFATIVVDDPTFIQSESNVDGDQVSIVVTWLLTNSLFFEGTLNTAQTQIDGTTSFVIKIGSVEINVPTGAATLTKQ